MMISFKKRNKELMNLNDKDFVKQVKKLGIGIESGNGGVLFRRIIKYDATNMEKRQNKARKLGNYEDFKGRQEVIYVIENE